jgi:hypothetical protein
MEFKEWKQADKDNIKLPYTWYSKEVGSLFYSKKHEKYLVPVKVIGNEEMGF